jgi:subtilisin family serine protease
LKYINWDGERLSYSGKNIKIAIIDSGIDQNIPELNCKIDIETSVVKSNKESDVKHGTAVASIISAENHSDNQVNGIAHNARIVSIDVTNQSEGIVEVDDLIKGIEKAIEYKVDIINISIGCLKDDKELKSVIKKAWDNNIIIVSSAGNYMKNNVLYPSKYKETLSVGSLNKKGKIISPQGDVDKKVVYFLGENIVSAIGNNEYAGCEGTSFSTAICTGLVALLLEKKNDKKSVKEYIENLDYSNGIDFIEIINNYK